MVLACFLIVSLTLCPLITAELDQSVCKLTANDQQHGPSLPQLPDRFTMRVEVNLLNKNSTIDVHEWHDGPGNRGAVNMWVSSVLLRYIFSYDTNEKFTIDPQENDSYTCRVDPLNATHAPYFYGTTGHNYNNNNDSTTPTTPNHNNNNKTAHIYTASQALSFGGNIAEQYLGRRRVRGIVTDVWQSCVHWPDLDATMSVQWYFTVANGWDTVVGVSQVPVRCQVNGTSNRDGGSRRFQHVYEVTEFFSYLDGGPQVFETPAGTVCPGRTNTKPLPTLPNMFSYSTELIDIEQQTIQFIKTAYDSQLKLTMKEQVSPVPPFSKLRVIHDFNTRVSYTLDTTRGNCTISAIEPTASDATAVTATMLRMRTPQELFFDTNAGQLSYEGIRSLRQLNTEVWVGRKAGPPHSPKSQDSIWEYYFTTPEWQENGGGENSGKSVPVSIHVVKPGQSIHEQHNLYDFRDVDPRVWDYDITSCFDDSQQFSQLSFYFPVTSAQLLTVFTNQDSFRRALLNSVTSLVTISPMRVNNIQLEFRKGRVEVAMVVLEIVKLTSSTVTSPLQEVSLGVAVARLMDAVTERRLRVQIPTSNGSLALTASATVATTSATVTSSAAAITTTGSMTTATAVSTATPTTPLLCSSHISGYTPGDVAGVSMGMTCACYLLTLMTLTLWTRRRSTSPSYQCDRMELS